MENLPKFNNSSANKDVKLLNSNGFSPGNQARQQPQKSMHKDLRVEHQFLNKMPDINSVENDLMKLLNDFSETRLKKYGPSNFTVIENKFPH